MYLPPFLSTFGHIAAGTEVSYYFLCIELKCYSSVNFYIFSLQTFIKHCISVSKKANIELNRALQLSSTLIVFISKTATFTCLFEISFYSFHALLETPSFLHCNTP
jgi:hypothetical protein